MEKVPEMKHQVINLKGWWNKTDKPLKVIRGVRDVKRSDYGTVTGVITYNNDNHKVLKLGNEWFLADTN